MSAAQRPLGSGLGARTTAREALGALRLDGRRAIVTGGYAGIRAPAVGMDRDVVPRTGG